MRNRAVATGTRAPRGARQAQSRSHQRRTGSRRQSRSVFQVGGLGILGVVKDHHRLLRRILVDIALGRVPACGGVVVTVNAVAVPRLAIDGVGVLDDGPEHPVAAAVPILVIVRLHPGVQACTGHDAPGARGQVAITRSRAKARRASPIIGTPTSANTPPSIHICMTVYTSAQRVPSIIPHGFPCRSFPASFIIAKSGD